MPCINDCFLQGIANERDDKTRSETGHLSVPVSERNYPLKFKISSLIQTITVGSGITPDLLDLLEDIQKRSRTEGPGSHYRRWGIAPRPEESSIQFVSIVNPSEDFVKNFFETD